MHLGGGQVLVSEVLDVGHPQAAVSWGLRRHQPLSPLGAHGLVEEARGDHNIVKRVRVLGPVQGGRR